MPAPSYLLKESPHTGIERSTRCSFAQLELHAHVARDGRMSRAAGWRMNELFCYKMADNGVVFQLFDAVIGEIEQRADASINGCPSAVPCTSMNLLLPV
jgi:hypothetical protein